MVILGGSAFLMGEVPCTPSFWRRSTFGGSTFGASKLLAAQLLAALLLVALLLAALCLDRVDERLMNRLRGFRGTAHDGAVYLPQGLGFGFRV